MRCEMLQKKMSVTHRAASNACFDVIERKSSSLIFTHAMLSNLRLQYPIFSTPLPLSECLHSNSHMHSKYYERLKKCSSSNNNNNSLWSNMRLFSSFTMLATSSMFLLVLKKKYQQRCPAYKHIFNIYCAQ